MTLFIIYSIAALIWACYTVYMYYTFTLYDALQKKWTNAAITFFINIIAFPIAIFYSIFIAKNFTRKQYNKHHAKQI